MVVKISRKFSNSDDMFSVYECEYSEQLGWISNNNRVVIKNLTNGSVKWLQNDIWIVYGDFKGVEQYKSTFDLTGKTIMEELPYIEVKEADFVSD